MTKSSKINRSEDDLDRRFRLIAEFNNRLNSIRGLETVVQELLSGVISVLEADACILRRIDGDRLVRMGDRGVPEGAMADTIPSNVGIAAELIGKGQPVCIQKAEEDPLTSGILEKPIVAAKKPFIFRSYAGAPVFADGRIIGVLGVYMVQEPRYFGSSDLTFLQIIANMVGSRLQQEKLLKQISEAPLQVRRQVTEILEIPHSDEPENKLARLEYAFRQNLNRLTVEFQPIRKPCQHSVEGFEALARWRHPEIGPVSPSQFIPLAERIGLMSAAGEKIRSAALGDFPKVCTIQNPCFLSLNVSTYELDQPDFSRQLMQSLPADYNSITIILEITERAILQHDSVAGRNLIELSEMGVPLFIDDFGAGYSSLSHLIDMPFKGIKIDKQFIPDHASDERRIQLLSTLVIMAKEMGLTVIAEGIETSIQEELVYNIGADLVQGYAIGRPASADKLIS